MASRSTRAGCAVSGDAVVMQVEGLAHAHFQYNQISQANSPLPTTASPRLALLCADEKGAVNVAVNPSGGGIVHGNQIYYDNLGNGRFVGRGIAVQGAINISSGYYAPSASAGSGTSSKKLLADVKFDAYDLSGKLVPKAEALKRLKAGGLVLLAGDGQFPDANYLKAFRDDILVLVSGDFVFPQGAPNPYDMPVNRLQKLLLAPAGPLSQPSLRSLRLRQRFNCERCLRPPSFDRSRSRLRSSRHRSRPTSRVRVEEKPAAKPAEAKPPVKPQ